MKYLTYNPEQGYLLPPSVREVLGDDPVCFFVHRAVERLDLSALEQGYVEEGRAAYHPALLLESVAVRLRSGGHLVATAGAAGQRGPGVSLSGGWSGAGPLDAERFPPAARTRLERRIHAGGGDGPLAGAGASGARGD